LCTFAVALRKESVDRNPIVPAELVTLVKSLSARRAWIEICCPCRSSWLLASLSARRAWIEIHVRCFSPAGCWVALRKESVDRNGIMKQSAST